MRVLSALMQDMLSGSRDIRVSLIVRLHLTSGTWGGADWGEDFTFAGQFYKAFGAALRVQMPAQTVSGRPQPGSLSLSGTDPYVLSTFFAETYRNQLAELSFLVVKNSTGEMEELPWAKARCDTASIVLEEQKTPEPDRAQIHTLTLSVAPLNADITRPGSRTRSDADQTLHRDPSDHFFKDVGVAAKATIYWGKAGPTSPGAVHPGGLSGGVGGIGSSGGRSGGNAMNQF